MSNIRLKKESGVSNKRLTGISEMPNTVILKRD